MKRLGKIVLMGFAAIVIACLVVFMLLTAVSLSTVGGCIYRAGISSAIVLDISRAPFNTLKLSRHRKSYPTVIFNMILIRP